MTKFDTYISSYLVERELDGEQSELPPEDPFTTGEQPPEEDPSIGVESELPPEPLKLAQQLELIRKALLIKVETGELPELSTPIDKLSGDELKDKFRYIADFIASRDTPVV